LLLGLQSDSLVDFYYLVNPKIYFVAVYLLFQLRK